MLEGGSQIAYTKYTGYSEGVSFKSRDSTPGSFSWQIAEVQNALLCRRIMIQYGFSNKNVD